MIRLLLISSSTLLAGTAIAQVSGGPAPLAARPVASASNSAIKPPNPALPMTITAVPVPPKGIHRSVRHPRPNASTARVDVANRKALMEPRASGYLNAVQVYPWSEGALYRLFAAPECVSDIALQPGEALVSVAAGDTVRWIVGDTTSGAGGDKRTHILIKPSASGLRTNLVIATDKRIYHLQLESTAATSMSAISWVYPQDALLALRRDGAAEPVSVGTGRSIQNLRFGYTISGDNPAWRPVRAFDDGQRTFIAFPASLAVGEAPPLFIRGPKGEAELVNYRVSGNYYIIDRLFDVAELRLGTKHQQVVKITRDDDAERHHSKRRAS